METKGIVTVDPNGNPNDKAFKYAHGKAKIAENKSQNFKRTGNNTGFLIKNRKEYKYNFRKTPTRRTVNDVYYDKQ